jgi:hypothetical protein
MLSIPPQCCFYFIIPQIGSNMETILSQLLATMPTYLPTHAMPRYASQRISCSCIQTPPTAALCRRCDGAGTLLTWQVITAQSTCVEHAVDSNGASGRR